MQTTPTFRPLLSGLAAAMREPAPVEASGDLYQTFTDQLAAHFDLDTVLRFVLDRMAMAAGAERGFISLIDPGGMLLHSLVWGAVGDPQALFPHSAQAIPRVIAEKRSLAIASDGALHTAAVPLRIGAEVVGLVYLERREPAGRFSRQELARLEGLAAYATMAIHHVRQNSDMALRLQKLRLINEVSLAISGTIELDRLLALILRHSLALTGGEQGYILSGAGDEVSCLASRDARGASIDSFEISRSVLARCLEENRSICILDTHEDQLNQTDSVMALDLRSVMCVPLLANGRRLGALYISSRVISKTFTPEDQSMLEAIANQAALALHNAQLLKEQEGQIATLAQALQQLHEAQARAMTDGLTGLYNHAYFKEVLGGAILEADRYGRELSLVLVDLDRFKWINDTHGHQAGDEVLRQVSATLGAMVRDCDVLARYGGEELALLLPNTDQQGAAILAERLREAIASLAVPCLDGRTLSVTASLGLAGHRRGLSSAQLIEAADKALYAAKNSGRNRVCLHGASVPLEDLLKRRALEKGAFLETLDAIAEVRRGGEADRVADTVALARTLGEALGLSGYRLQELEMAAAYYDVGKSGVPDAILEKPEGLEPHELEVVRMHPIQGARLFLAGNLPGVAQIIRYHHEAWDGEGYPDRIRGEEIPLPARILAVVDAYQAMLSDRPYRAALTPSEAAEEIRRGSGTRFDPRVVEAFLELLASRRETPGE